MNQTWKIIIVIIIATIIIAGGIFLLYRNSSSGFKLGIGNDLDPDKFTSVTLKDSGKNYVKSSGEVKINVELQRGKRVWMTIDQANSPNQEINPGPYLLPFIYYVAYPDPKSTYGGNHVDKERKLELISDNIYSFVFTAPEIPGEYKIVFSAPFRKEYTLTVINKVPDKLMAYKVADRHIFSQLKSDGTARNWKVISKDIKLKNNKWEIDIKIEYDSCNWTQKEGDMFESEECEKKYIGGNYLIDKQSGVIN